MILGIVLISAFLFVLGYLFYARYLEKALRIDMSEQTPAHTMRDGVDYDPAPRMVLFGHHFSAIAGSGPIVGPIVAGLAFGWGPALLWILVGCILLGAPHDFSCLIASVRNKGKSLGEIAKHFLGAFAYKVFLWFLFVVMIYVLSVFVDLTASTFVPPTKESSLQGGMVATSSLIYIFLAVGFGYILRHFKVSAGKLSWIFVPLIFISIWVSSYIPLTPELVSKLGFNPHILWISVLLIYCAFASILPVWILLQPRDYLSAFLLYACLLIGFIGILFSGFIGDISIQDDILVLDYQIPNEGDGWFVLRDHSGIFIPVSIWNRTGEDTVRLCWDLSTLAGEQRLGLNIQETLESQSNWESPLISFDLQKRTFTFSKILESIDGVRNIHVEYKR